MSSATASLFACVALAVIGAAGFAYTLSHPGAVSRLLLQANDRAAAIVVDANSRSNEAGPGDAMASARGAGTAEIAAGAYGHFETDAEINGRSIPVMVDTGASVVALTYEDAARLGIYVQPSDFKQTAKTANGMTLVAPVTVERISIGDITVRRVPAVVSARGKSDKTLLGMSFLGRLSRVEMRSGTLVLEE